MADTIRKKPLDFLKNDTSTVMAEVAASPEPLFLTEEGRARLALLDADRFLMLEEQLALLTVLAQGQQEIAQGRYRDVDAAFAELEQDKPE